MLGEIVPTKFGQLGAYRGPHVEELPTFTPPAELFGTLRRLAGEFERQSGAARSAFSASKE